jgi:hypothetical protein
VLIDVTCVLYIGTAKKAKGEKAKKGKSKK